ncbi:lysoplasmalogenase family protein [Microbacterium sp. ZW T5_45]|uniref:lysoplasmalogenase family protein n=1 Tax=Microbacterium sp. ZW T5_45 TaxID=3378080 RepID=UPI0038554361
MPRRRLLLAFAPYVAVSAVHVALLAIHNDLAGPTKLLLMPSLAIPVILRIRHITDRASVALLLAALLFSWLGDSAGTLFPDAPELPLMLGFFGIAHIIYIALFIRHLARRRLPWWTLIYGLWWIGMLSFLGPHVGGLLLAVAAYGLVLAGTAASAARTVPLVAVGGAFFLTSDTILAIRLFLPNALPDWSSPAVMLTYTLGQGLIVAGALVALSPSSVGHRLAS